MVVIGYTVEIDTSFSPHTAVVAVFRERRMGNNSSIRCQFPSVSSRVRASESGVTSRSDSTEDTAHRCSSKRSNMP